MKNFIFSFIALVAVISLFLPIIAGAAADNSQLILQLQQQLMSLQTQLNSLIAQQGSQGPSNLPAGQILGVTSFTTGDHIQTVSVVNIRATPSLSGAILAVAPGNATGVLHCDLAGATACPTVANGYN